MFDKADADEMIDRIYKLGPNSTPVWGKMSVGQMLAHCCVTYEFIYTDKHPRPKGLKRILIKLFAKPIVTGPKPYPKNSRTAAVFMMTSPKEFAAEQARLIDYIRQTQAHGPDYFVQQESHSFGMLSEQEWNTMFSKHLDHHLRQFGV